VRIPLVGATVTTGERLQAGGACDSLVPSDLGNPRRVSIDERQPLLLDGMTDAVWACATNGKIIRIDPGTTGS